MNAKLKEAKIMIVDDQEANVAVLESLLAKEGYERTLGITDARKVLKLYSEYQPDLILLDLLMPHLDGYAVLAQLRNVVPADTYLPILVLTADITPEARQRALSSGAKDFITKPIDVIEVGLRIRNLLETRFLHRQIQNRSQILNEMVLERTGELSLTNAQLRAEINERRQAEAALAVREEYFRALTEHAPDGIVLLGLDGRLKYASPSTTRILGYPSNEVVGREPRELTHPDDLPAVLIEWNKVIQNPDLISTIQYRFRHADGSWHWIESTITNLAAVKPVEALVFNYRDITDRKQAEAKANQETARAESLLQIASRLNTKLNLETVLSTVCEAATQALNTSTATVYLYEAVHDRFTFAAGCGLPTNYKSNLQPVPREVYERVLQGGKSFFVENIQLVPEAHEYIPVYTFNIQSIASVHLMQGKQIIANLAVYTFGKERIFTTDEITLLQGLADQAALAIANARLYQEAQQHLQNMQALHRIDTTINSTLDLNLILKTILEQLTSHLHVDAADILLTNPRSNYLEFAVGHGFRTTHIRKTQVRFGYDLPGYVALEQRSVHIQHDLDKQLEIQRFNLLAPEGFQGYYGIPLIAKGKLQGVIEIFHRSPLEVTEEWLDFVGTLAAQAALAIDHTQLFASVQRSNMELGLAYDVTLEGWSRAMDLRDRETEGHTQRVAEMTVQLAEALGLSDSEIINARRGALLHDMGKLGIPDEILLKPGKLTEEEWEIMKKHPGYAYEMLYPIAFLRPALDIPYCHHEKWDGTGYPRGLKGTDIPIAARIFSIADVWDALRSDRPYRKAWPKDKVLTYIKEHSGDYFDPQVVEVFLHLLETNVIRVENHQLGGAEPSSQI